MTPEEMGRAVLANIEAARATLEDGPLGYVLQSKDKMRLVCQRDGNVWVGDPQNDAVAVLTTHARAVVLQRWWNSNYPDYKVTISLRREAMVAYIDTQQKALDTLFEFLDLTKGATK